MSGRKNFQNEYTTRELLISEDKKGHCVHQDQTETANEADSGTVTKTKQSAIKTPMTNEESQKNTKDASHHERMSDTKAAENQLPSSHCESPACIEHLIKLMVEQQKQHQNQHLHIVQQLLDKQKESFEQLLMHLKDNQQHHQQVLLEILLPLKENQQLQNQKLQLFTDVLQELNIKQQNNCIDGQHQQQQKEFQDKLMVDIANQTEEQVKVLLQAYNKCETHQTPYNSELPDQKSGYSFYPGPSNAFGSLTNSPGYSQDQRALDLEPSRKIKVQNTAMQTRELFNCEPIGKQFCEQFYPLWNSQNPSYKQTGNIVWGPHLFWENATADFLSEHSNAEIVQHFEGFQCVSDFLLSLTNQERLDFRPCIDNEKFKCANSKHGLVVVAVTGTIFREETCVGIFQQTFGLIQCPEANSLKIKFTNLKMKYYNNHMENAIAAPDVEFTTEQLENM